jgi:hypothetical protein
MMNRLKWIWWAITGKVTYEAWEATLKRLATVEHERAIMLDAIHFLEQRLSLLSPEGNTK